MHPLVAFVTSAFVSGADLADSAREAFFMFWETLWALILGFTLSGAVQAFVSKDQMQRVMGDHRPGSVTRASGFGMMSSSCSYAASAMAKSLFQKGADFVAAMVFMFASTNLVIELGIVLLVLMGWQFALAQFVGGFIMIVLLALTGGYVIREALVRRSRERLRRGEEGTPPEERARIERMPWRTKLTSRTAWSDAAGYTISDVTMLRRELLIGYGVAGLLTMLVPMDVWNVLFVEGHGFWTSLENALVGPIIAFVSFVCSIGNVPMAAALWHGGISFGGVISFIFADLLALPLIVIYRKYYGTRLTIRLVAWFYAVMVVAALLVEGIFALAGAIPESRPETVVESHFSWNYTTFLNLVFLGVFGVVYWLYRTRGRTADRAYATDPVCSMQVEKANAPAHLVVDGRDVWFCSDGCAEKYARARAAP
jgi:uncharacterized membrane protein YraQ (UPF0718 family)/YHS domain-containing protein